MTSLGIIEILVIGVGALLTLLGLVYMRDKATQDRFHSMQQTWQDRMNDLQHAWQTRMDDLRGWCSGELTQLSNTCLRRDEIKDHINPIHQRLDQGLNQMRDDNRDLRAEIKDLAKRVLASKK